MQGRLILVHLACRDMDSFDMTGPSDEGDDVHHGDIAVAASNNSKFVLK